MYVCMYYVCMYEVMSRPKFNLYVCYSSFPFHPQLFHQQYQIVTHTICENLYTIFSLLLPSPSLWFKHSSESFSHKQSTFLT